MVKMQQILTGRIVSQTLLSETQGIGMMEKAVLDADSYGTKYISLISVAQLP